MASWGKAKRKGSYRKGDPTKQNLKKPHWLPSETSGNTLMRTKERARAKPSLGRGSESRPRGLEQTLWDFSPELLPLPPEAGLGWQLKHGLNPFPPTASGPRCLPR